MTIELPQFPDVGALTHSSESTFKSCQRRYFLRYVLGLVPSHDSDPLRIGGAFHEGLEVSKRGGDEAAVDKAVRDRYADEECPPWLSADEFAVECETAAAMAVAWHRRWKDDQILDYVAVELSFDLPILNPATGRSAPRVRNRGKIDGIARLPDGRLALIEHKTTGDSIELGGDYWTQLMLDAQISRYVLAARQLGYQIDTTLFDVTRKPAIRPKNVAKTDRAYASSTGRYFDLPLTGNCPEHETPKMFGARLRADIAERPSFYFGRSEIPRIETDLVEFKSEQWILKNQIQESHRQQRRGWGSSAWPRNTKACTIPYTCPYLSICRGALGDPQLGIPIGYKRANYLHPELTEQPPCRTKTSRHAENTTVDIAKNIETSCSTRTESIGNELMEPARP